MSAVLTDPNRTRVHRHKHTSRYNVFVRANLKYFSQHSHLSSEVLHIVDQQYLTHGDSICAERLVGEIPKDMNINRQGLS